MKNNDFKNTELENIFSSKLTENGDFAYNTVGNHLSDILFMTAYYEKNLNRIPKIGTTLYEKLFSMFIRDPRFGIGRRDLGRALLKKTKATPQMVLDCGRWDDIFEIFDTEEAAKIFYKGITEGDFLAKKWAPRYSSKNLMKAREFAKLWKMNKQEYGKFVKAVETPEFKLSSHNTDAIDFSKLPSLALLKYWKRFAGKNDTKERFQKYLESVKKGESKMNVSTTNVYDIYRNRAKIDADLVYSQLEKISGSWLPIIDVSGSMFDRNDSIGKALSIGKYLADTSTYCPNSFITFSSDPKLVKLGAGTYNQQLNQINSSNWGFNTNLGKVMEMLIRLKKDMPEYLVILSDMEFDYGSSMKKDALMNLWKSKGWTTKIVWWNFNSRNETCPEMDKSGNIFLSGYNPMLLKYLEAGFDNDKFIEKLLFEYFKNVRNNSNAKDHLIYKNF